MTCRNTGCGNLVTTPFVAMEGLRGEVLRVSHQRLLSYSVQVVGVKTRTVDARAATPRNLSLAHTFGAPPRDTRPDPKRDLLLTSADNRFPEPLACNCRLLRCCCDDMCLTKREHMIDLLLLGCAGVVETITAFGFRWLEFGLSCVKKINLLVWIWAGRPAVPHSTVAAPCIV